jgi:hypothetical protein
MSVKRPKTLSKERALHLLAGRLGCSVNSVSFLFERPAYESPSFKDITIPNMYEAMK